MSNNCSLKHNYIGDCVEGGTTKKGEGSLHKDFIDGVEEKKGHDLAFSFEGGKVPNFNDGFNTLHEIGGIKGKRRTISIKGRAQNVVKNKKSSEANNGQKGGLSEKNDVVVDKESYERRVHDPDIIFLVESKLSRTQAERLVFNLNLENWWAVDRCGLSGGLLLLWKTDVSLKVLSWSTGHIAAMVLGKGMLPWLFSGFYGNLDQSKRSISWDLLRKIRSIQAGACLCMGDFNEISLNSDKIGGNSRSSLAMENFRKALDDCGLMDFGSVSQEMTWHGRGILERLDRALCNKEWFDLFPNAYVEVLDWLCSNHRPILAHFKERDSEDKCGLVKRNTRFHFEEAWYEDSHCRKVVSECWEKAGSCRSAMGIKNKILRCGNSLKAWKIKRKKDWNREQREAKKVLSNLSKANDPSLWKALKETEDKIICLEEKEEMYWRQRSRALWLKNGDRNSKYFRYKASARRKKNTILGLRDAMGVWKDEEIIVEKVICDYFSNLFSSSEVSFEEMAGVISGMEKKISDSMNSFLETDFTEEEVITAIKNMNPTKAPGTDGLPALFYQKFWNEVNKDVVGVCLSVLNGGGSIDCLNDTLIALIPKVEKPERIEQFRPISLCNVIYKIISKCMADHMRISMGDAIFEAQSAFVPGRVIQNNAIIGFEALHCLRKNYYGNGTKLALKLDMAKAYDRVEWNFVEAVMLKLGYCGSWVEKVMRCVRSITFSILLNGNIKGNIKPSRGLKQGPFVTVPLPFLCRSLLFSNQKCGGKCLVFLEADERNCLEFKRILESYSKVSGQVINIDKSDVSFGKSVGLEYKKRMAELLNVNLAIPTYVMSCFKIPKKIIDSLHGMAARFWWGSTDKKRKIHWCKWDVLCLPKDKGGLGFRNLHLFNQAMLAKQVWRFLRSPSSLCARVLKACYFPNGSILDANCGSNASCVWHSLVWGKSIINQGSRWRIGNGNSVNVLKDPWIPRPRTFRIFDQNFVREDLHVIDLKHENGDWDEVMLKCLFNEENANLILSLPCSDTNLEDKLRKLNCDKICSRCSRGGSEDVAHALWRCKESTKIWKASFFWQKIKSCEIDPGLFIMHMNSVLNKREFELFVIISWQIWFLRNRARLGERGPKPSDVVEWCSSFWVNFGAVNGKSRKLSVKRENNKWKPPDMEWLKVNVDVGVQKEDGSWKLAAVARNWRGQVQGVRLKVLRSRVEPMVAELWAILEGMKLGGDLIGACFGVESDCFGAVGAICKPSPGIFDWDGVLDSISSLAHVSNFRGVSFVCREANRLAHCLAKSSQVLGSSAVWNEALPLDASAVAIAEMPIP
ncbi:uncharacterized protein LOC133785369 [Humulus lupulus]|uniref:uncharacterized protein LOC133785369 n=1 Tax=Humulus lupulus TaxID=3486 RepID=UPI002B40263E|nr:uncharacterized protein LOC133785369 [Humulus lupulus]